MREYVDLHITPKNKERMLKKARALGYSIVGFCGSDILRKEWITHAHVASRINIVPKNLNDLMTQLKIQRRKYQIVSVECSSIKIARQAAKDHRVDVLRFSSDRESRRKVWFDHHEAKLASDSNAVYEICLSDILGKGPSIVYRVLTTWRMELNNAFRYEVPIIVSSGATSICELRGPKALASIMALLNVEDKQSLDMVSTVPYKLIQKNREKLDSSFVTPGVRVY